MTTSRVSATNDFSIASKRSMVDAGYFHDEYISYFSSKLKRRSPLINVGYYVRAKVIDSALQFFLNHPTEFESQVISLGAGFDTTYFRCCRNRPHVNYFEIDFPDVVRRKRGIIEENNLAKENYVLIAQDLSNTGELQSALASSGCDFLKRTLILSECAITYMDEEKSSELIKWTSREFSNACFLTYEQVLPFDGFGIVMKNHFKELHTPLKSLAKYPTDKDQKDRYLSQGWSSCSVFGAFDVFTSLTPRDEILRALRIEPFDEFEEWHLTCCHYVLVVASHGERSMEDFKRKIETRNALPVSEVAYELTGVPLTSYGHEAVPVGDWGVVTFGGLPSQNHYYVRIDKAAAEAVSLADFKNIKFLSSCILGRDEKSTDLFVYGGRKSPLECCSCTKQVSISESDSRVTLKINDLIINGDGVTPRWKCTISRLGDFLFVFGGRTPRLEVLGDMWYFNLKERSWRLHQGTGPQPRFSHASTILGSKMYITGGLDVNLQPLDDLWVFDLQTDSWAQLNVFLLPRYGHRALAAGGKLFLVGGVNLIPNCQPGIAVIDLESGVSKEYTFQITNENESFFLCNFTCHVTLDQETLYIHGGGGNCFSFGTSFNKEIIKIDLLQFRD